MDSKAALEQVAYMQSLVEENRLHAAHGYPYFIWWGLVWAIAYLLEYHFRNGQSWDVLGPIGFIGSFVIVLWRRKRRVHKSLPVLAKRLLFMNITLILMCLIIIGLVPDLYSPDAQLITTYYAFWVGMIYILNGVFAGREFVFIGLAMAILAVVSHWFGPATQLLILAIIGGGALLVTGFYLWSIERSLHA